MAQKYRRTHCGTAIHCPDSLNRTRNNYHRLSSCIRQAVQQIKTANGNHHCNYSALWFTISILSWDTT